MEPLGGPGGPAVLVRADETLPYRTVVRVLTILQQAHVTRMALVTQAEEGEPR